MGEERDYRLERAVSDIPDEEIGLFFSLTETELTRDQIDRVTGPWRVIPDQRDVLAVHWHPEWIPLDMAEERIRKTFPASENDLLIPTQHNDLLVMGNYAGVEVDCYSSGFNRKIQLLLHFRADRVARASALKSMLAHTFKYRSGQLFEFMDSIIEPGYSERMDEATANTGASSQVVEVVRFYTARLRQLIKEFGSRVDPMMIKNKLVAEYIGARRGLEPQNMINRALLLVKAVKEIVKRDFSVEYFFKASEVIEEARALGGGIIIPHPEQFWPVLLADYDVDGWEVWNPQSQEYTEFLIQALHNQNKINRPNRRKLLVFMGDDTHLSVKIRDPETMEKSKLEREIGLQPAWDALGIRKKLSLSGSDRRRTIEEYKGRLA
ncbi:MAG: hypothetical protein KKB20_23575 [Proteobacteria bacterium]|nr:hypothetical protein [Pseudomonadota bacterium]